MQDFRVLSPTGILGYGFPAESFMRGVAEKPDLIAVDGGSTDPGPYYLGAGKSFTDRRAVKRDLRFMLKEGVTRRIPVHIGTCGGSGAAPHLEWCRQIVHEIAAEEKLSFRMAVIRSDVPHAVAHAALDAGKIRALDSVPPLTHERIDQTPYIVAQIGIEPFLEAIDTGADVVIAGRSYDPVEFAALPIKLGYDSGLALHMGKILECAAIAATPGSGADCVLGTLKQDSFVLKALNDERRFTAESTAAHSLYEKSDPFFLPGPGGRLNLTGCTFTEIGNGRVEVRGSRHEESDPYFVKLEGSRRIGYRTVTIAGCRDPIMIRGIDGILAAAQEKVNGILKSENLKAQVFFHVYGKDGVMGRLEPVKQTQSHEIGILVEVLGATQEEADTVCSITRSTLLHYGYPGRVSTAGNLAFPFSPSDMRGGEVFEFSIYHLMEIADQSLFAVSVEQVG
ncbi:MAG: 3-methylaspartate ammonia-lyase [Lentisphaerae bacterium RIFOXYB12_FULL_65_16]|nr:MAG: 3-methylaspartate ammonia-lyase [Lentisphaerae bacterium RIFOXYA12_64_32]OGV86441.1 MAG: 3-methylaspartate ammonia-lyase [Lentisphaerae bacterium RIFOXYB12_FULL_65_16]